MRYFVGFLIFIGLFILAFILIFHHSSHSTAAKPIVLGNYANTNTVVQFTIDGPVVYDSSHNEIQITVGQYQNTLNIIQGYQGNVVKSENFPNNEPAYNVFLNALQIAGFTKSQKFNYPSTGACATGDVYHLSVIDDFGTNIQDLWATTCGNEGTFGGVVSPIQNLFEAQIPNYNKETAGVQVLAQGQPQPAF